MRGATDHDITGGAPQGGQGGGRHLGIGGGGGGASPPQLCAVYNVQGCLRVLYCLYFVTVCEKL